MTPDVNIVLLDFRDRPGREMVVENEDGSFTIIINSRLSTQGQRDAYYHARRHIDNDDFERSDVQSIEVAAHELNIPTNAEKIPESKYLARIKALQRRRKKIQKQLREYREDMPFLESCGGGFDSFARGEYQKLYGNNL